MNKSPTITPAVLDGLRKVWQAIGPDASMTYQVETGKDLPNGSAVEACLDCAMNEEHLACFSPEAHKELEDMFEVYGFDATYRSAVRKLKLV